MKRTALMQKVRKAAKVHGKSWRLVRHGKEHDLWAGGGTEVAIPRHTEIARGLAFGIFGRLERELGVDWWR